MKTDELIDNLSDDLSEVKVAKPFYLFLRWLVCMTIYSVALAFSGEGLLRADINEVMEQPHFVNEMVLALITAAMAGYLSFLIAVPDDNRKKIYNFLPLVPLATMGFVIFENGSISSQSLAASFADNHFLITLKLILFSIAPIILTFKMVKKLSPTSLLWNGFVIILASTALSHFLLRITGMADNLAPVLVWCYSPIIFLSLIGAHLGKKFLKW